MAYRTRDMTAMNAPLEKRRHYFGNQPNVSDENAVSSNYTTSAPLQPKTVSSPRAAVVASEIGLIHVLGYTPGEGEQGVPITAYINFTCHIGAAVRVRLIVGRRAIATQVRELADPSYGKWQVEGIIPPFFRQQTTSPKVLLAVQAINVDNVILDSVTFGEFTYWESSCNSPDATAHKQHLEDVIADNTPSMHPQQHTSTKPPNHRRRSSTPSPPRAPERLRPPVVRAPHTSRLHRRSNLHATRGKQLGGDSPTDHGHRAVLQLLSPLGSLCQGWDPTELHTGRRLVRFNKVQEGYKLKVTCERIKQEDYQESDIVVSCIYRDEEDSCCVTSVDIIYLLEKLVDDEFEVEEKNRIRRNLEGLRPTTISKHRPGFEDFFQRIMDFPDPKPRNIEKDVKVFDWNLLPQALEKIISKYSLCCSSEGNATEFKDVPKIEEAPSSSPSSSEGHHSNADVGNQDVFGPEFDTKRGQTPLFYSQDHSFPAAYVNPAVVNKYYAARPDDVIFMPLDITDLPTVLSPASPDTTFDYMADTSNLLHDANHSCSDSWDMNLVKAESPDGLITFDVPQTQTGADTYLVDGYGLSTYDSLEFQTLREHNIACSHSSP